MTFVVVSPLVMTRLSGTALPWGRLADVGDTFGGVSALLSAVALCGIGASLIFQQRQVRQEFADIDRQQHIELLKLAIDNPELIEVLSPETAAGSHARHELYANLMMMYWLAIWELGEIDDEQLRAMTADMFRGEVARNWWRRVGGKWISTRARAGRRRFVAIVNEEFHQAEMALQDDVLGPSGRPARTTALLVLVVAGMGAWVGLCAGRRAARKAMAG
ncbi:DUF6082 family protein [Paractinoplanes hotanensis]|uniref:DUF6082 family protein n=1 Tax=Paractinoplanes hotanensis TaxID=2906497 RepID=A0ABT0YDF9_9ACTN|nr:DUF6082 family protein [Actinoplanes hotanensis]MCM4084101.1 DUF6082 family protein [Actinoplanes hotanensis]